MAQGPGRERHVGSRGQLFMTKNASLLLIGLTLMAHTVIGAQSDKAAQIDAELCQVFPQAETWTFEDRESPHFRRYVGVGEKQELVGLAFVTTDITRTKGYYGPIPILVGMNLNGTITRILLFYHREPFGYFSIDLQEFSDQFENKSVLDPLIVGEDVDAITQATVTVETATRGIRQGARQLVRELLAEHQE